MIALILARCFAAARRTALPFLDFKQNVDKRTTFKRFFAEPAIEGIKDGQQAFFMSSFATYPLTDTLGGTGLAEGLAADGQYFAIFTDGHHRQLPRLTRGPFRYKTYAAEFTAKAVKMATKPVKQAVIAPSMLSLLYPLDGEVSGYTREQFLTDLVDECEKDIRGAFKAGAKRVSIDFTEGRLALRNDLKNPWTGRNMLGQFNALNNQVLDRFSVEERRNVGIHTCPGGDCDSTHSADVDYAECCKCKMRLLSHAIIEQERQGTRLQAGRTAQSCRCQRRCTGLLHWRHRSAESAGRKASRGLRRPCASRKIYPEGEARLDRRLRLLAFQHRHEAETWLTGHCA